MSGIQVMRGRKRQDPAKRDARLELVESVTALLDSPHTTVSIVHPTAAGFAERVRKRNDVELWTVTTANRDSLAETIVRWGGW